MPDETMTDAPLLAFYGDDLTGSTDVLEALSLRAIETVLFTGVPTQPQRDRFARARAFGIAGTSRSETPDWMDGHLATAFEWLAAQNAPLIHYKVCSTFDSAPHVGSIGRAIEIGRRVFGERPVPILVGAPQLRRYTAFGTLFAAFRDAVFRIDRHPVMSRHPVTPMAEADLRLHLKNQTALSIALFDLVASQAADGDARLARLVAERPGAILIDVADTQSQMAAGRHLRRLVETGHRFAVGSSGVEYALFETPRTAPTFEPLAPVGALSVVSGSCSPTTERQIRFAQAHGFTLLPIDPRAFVFGDEAAIESVFETALQAVRNGRSVIVNTAMGPDTDIGPQIDAIEGARHGIGRGLGRMQARLVRDGGLRRAVIAGGDTSSHALQALGAYALTLRLPFPQTPGSPVVIGHCEDPALDGIELAMKGGQVGGDDYFVRLRDGD